MKSLFITIFITLLVGCGGGSEVTTNNNTSRVNADNYVDIAQYYFVKQYSNLNDNDKKVRNKIYPAQTKENLNDVFVVKAVTPLNKSVEKLDISYNNQNIVLSVDDDTVNIKYLQNNNIESTTSMTLEEFKIYGRDM